MPVLDTELHDHPVTLEERVILYASVVFFLLTAMFLGALVVFSFRGVDLVVGQNYYFAFTVVAAGLGFALIRTLRVGRKEVIPQPDRHVLEKAIQASPDPIGEYVKLSGLIGTTGLFRKLEFSGMPLATILMTLILCLLSLAVYILNSKAGTQIPEQLSTGFFELAKLTLGAFIGSFVSRSGRQERLATKETKVSDNLGGADIAQEGSE